MPVIVVGGGGPICSGYRNAVAGTGAWYRKGWNTDGTCGYSLPGEVGAGAGPTYSCRWYGIWCWNTYDVGGVIAFLTSVSLSMDLLLLGPGL